MLSCTKYEEKIRGQWQIAKIYKDKVETQKEAPTNVENLLSIWTFYRSSIVVMKYSNQGVLYETSGNWTIDKKDKQLTVSFSDLYENVNRIYRIEKFKSNELKVVFLDSEQTEWLLVFSLKYSLQDYDI